MDWFKGLARKHFNMEFCQEGDFALTLTASNLGFPWDSSTVGKKRGDGGAISVCSKDSSPSQHSSATPSNALQEAHRDSKENKTQFEREKNTYKHELKKRNEKKKRKKNPFRAVEYVPNTCTIGKTSTLRPILFGLL